jgi:hypothetical protein
MSVAAVAQHRLDGRPLRVTNPHVTQPETGSSPGVRDHNATAKPRCVATRRDAATDVAFQYTLTATLDMGPRAKNDPGGIPLVIKTFLVCSCNIRLPVFRPKGIFNLPGISVKPCLNELLSPVCESDVE